MEIQGKEFENGKQIFYVDYARSEHAGAAGCFQVADISIDKGSETSILKDIKIDQGKHYLDINELVNDLNLDTKKQTIEWKIFKLRHQSKLPNIKGGKTNVLSKLRQGKQGI